MSGLTTKLQHLPSIPPGGEDKWPKWQSRLRRNAGSVQRSDRRGGRHGDP
jgi:hypothetical protein